MPRLGRVKTKVLEQRRDGHHLTLSCLQVRGHCTICISVNCTMYFSKLKTCVNCQAKRETNNIWLYHPSKLSDYQDSFSMYLFEISNCICQKRVGGHLTLRCLRLDWLLTHQGFPTHLAQYWTTCNCSPTVLSIYISLVQTHFMNTQETTVKCVQKPLCYN